MATEPTLEGAIASAAKELTDPFTSDEGHPEHPQRKYVEIWADELRVLLAAAEAWQAVERNRWDVRESLLPHVDGTYPYSVRDLYGSVLSAERTPLAAVHAAMQAQEGK